MKITFKLLLILVLAQSISYVKGKLRENQFILFLQKQKKDILQFKSQSLNETSNPDKISERLLDHYFNIFQVLDRNSDGVINRKEIEAAAMQHDWPKKELKDNMSFAEFCDYMEGLFMEPDLADKEKENEKIELTISKIKSGFEFINSISMRGTITEEQLLKGLSAFLRKNIKELEVHQIFQFYKSEEITENEFILAIANGFLDRSFEDIIKDSELAYLNKNE